MIFMDRTVISQKRSWSAAVAYSQGQFISEVSIVCEGQYQNLTWNGQLPRSLYINSGDT